MEAIDTDSQAPGPPVDGQLEAAALLRKVLGPHADELLSAEGMADTPRRMAKALRELTRGYGADLGTILGRTFAKDGYDQIVVVNRIPFNSMCEHHVLPFTGSVDVAYLPGERIVGLSKIPRLVNAVSARLQVQERMTAQIATAIETHLEPRGVAVRVTGEHTCMKLRGVKSGGNMVTSDVRGVFRNSPEARAEVFGLMRGK